MAEYIEREAAKKVLAFGVGVTAANALDNVPAADVAPVVHGRWMYAINTRRRYAPVADDMICSACRRVTERLDGVRYYYCPLCGAKTDEDGD